MKRFLAILVFAGLIFAAGCKKDEKKVVHKKGKVSVQELDLSDYDEPGYNPDGHGINPENYPYHGGHGPKVVPHGFQPYHRYGTRCSLRGDYVWNGKKCVKIGGNIPKIVSRHHHR